MDRFEILFGLNSYLTISQKLFPSMNSEQRVIYSWTDFVRKNSENDFSCRFPGDDDNNTNNNNNSNRENNKGENVQMG